MVQYDKPSDSYTVDFAGFSMMVIRAIQEQQDVLKGILYIEMILQQMETFVDIDNLLKSNKKDSIISNVLAS